MSFESSSWRFRDREKGRCSPRTVFFGEILYDPSAQDHVGDPQDDATLDAGMFSEYPGVTAMDVDHDIPPSWDADIDLHHSRLAAMMCQLVVPRQVRGRHQL